MALRGHLWTLGPTLLHRVRPERAPEAEAWPTPVADPRVGGGTPRGLYRRVPGAQACVVVVHGLGGTTDTFYCIRAAQVAEELGLSCLRLALRGADRRGEDFYHAGLVEDLAAAVASEALAGYARIHVLGYSLGGHVSLRYALSPSDARVASVAAIGPPLDLERGAQAIDHARSLVYRRHVLAGLKEIYAAVAERREVPTPVERVEQAATIRAWDGLTVVPRYGFDDVAHYYAAMSAGPRLAEIGLPTLIVQSEHDPMVPPWTYRDHLARELPSVTAVHLPVGGHVSFPARVRFPDGAHTDVERYALSWLTGEARGRA